MAFLSDTAWLAGWLTVAITIITIACSIYDGESKRKRILKDIEIYEKWFESGSAGVLKDLREKIDSEIDKLNVPFYNRYAYQIMLAIGLICITISFPFRQHAEPDSLGILMLSCGLMMAAFYLFGSIFEIVLRRRRTKERAELEAAAKAVYWSYFGRENCDDEIIRDVASEKHTREIRDSLAWILGFGDPVQEKISREFFEKKRRQVVEENQMRMIDDYLSKDKKDAQKSVTLNLDDLA